MAPPGYHLFSSEILLMQNLATGTVAPVLTCFLLMKLQWVLNPRQFTQICVAWAVILVLKEVVEANVHIGRRRICRVFQTGRLLVRIPIGLHKFCPLAVKQAETKFVDSRNCVVVLLSTLVSRGVLNAGGRFADYVI